MSNGFWLEIQDAAGIPVGDGHIYTAQRWNFAAPLDAIGRFSFTIPAADPRAQYLTAERRVRCYAVQGGEVVRRGTGIIQNIRHSVDAGGVSLTVSGPSVLQEWADTVVYTQFQTTGNRTPQEVHLLEDLGGSTAIVDWPWTYDGDTSGTGVTPDGWGTGDFVYVRYDSPIAGLKFYLGTYNATQTAVTRVQYFDGNYWVDYVITDGTITASHPFGQDGAITWALTGNERQTLHNDEMSYWVRLLIGFNFAAMEINEVEVVDVAAATDAITTLAALVSGWTATGITATSASRLLANVRGESALEVARRITEYGTGVGNPRGHFRYGGDRVIEWLVRSTTADGDSGIVAMQAGTAAFGYESTVVLIESMNIEQDTSDRVTTLYPMGTGNGDSMVSLQRLYDEGYVLPSGYSWVTKSGGFPNAATMYGIENDDLVTEIGRTIERVVPMRDAAPIRGAGSPRHAASQLLNKSLVWLGERSEAQKIYRLKLTKIESDTLSPGNTLRVIYQGFDSDGTAYLDIDERFFILNVDILITGGEGTESMSLTVSNIMRHPQTDAEMVADMYGQVMASWRANQPVLSANVNGLVGGLPAN